VRLLASGPAGLVAGNNAVPCVVSADMDALGFLSEATKKEGIIDQHHQASFVGIGERS
jgi:hypothetical protein